MVLVLVRALRSASVSEAGEAIAVVPVCAMEVEIKPAIGTGVGVGQRRKGRLGFGFGFGFDFDFDLDIGLGFQAGLRQEELRDSGRVQARAERELRWLGATAACSGQAEGRCRRIRCWDQRARSRVWAS